MDSVWVVEGADWDRSWIISVHLTQEGAEVQRSLSEKEAKDAGYNYEYTVEEMPVYD